MTHEQRIEAAAKAIYDHWANYPSCSASKSWDEICVEREPEANDFRRKARAAIAAYLGDDVVVPTSPTEEMLAAVDFHVVGCCNMHDSDSIEVYSAMLAACPLADRGKR